ncbi:hypothetical protein [Lentzea sp. CC55]|uniref:hypothetical protein n=1 Tax=Lentzea sp. CC55 TaxID=2884909 RepID=UPI001F460926|nr:hypothetical protein [Lentzea sp. CC55]MCG8925619.1 hypothetical protein [Lentzea sp. CC55]
MVAFSPTDSPHLYAAPAPGVWVALYLPDPPDPPPASITLADAFAGPGTFVFSAAPGLDLDHYAGAVVDAVPLVLRDAHADRGVVWLTDPRRPGEGAQVIGLRTFPGGTVVSPGRGLPLVPGNLFLTVGNGVGVALDGDVVTLTPVAGAVLGFTGAAAPSSAVVEGPVTLPFSGTRAGSVVFGVSIARKQLLTDLRWGFQLLCPGSGGVRAQWYPLAEATGLDVVPFAASVDPSDPTNARLAGRTRLGFTTATGLVSGFRTAHGGKVTLVPVTSGDHPAGLTLALGSPRTPSPPGFAFGPEGDFTVDADTELLCGLSPTETMILRGGPSGDRLRFTANRPAFTGDYPPPVATTLGVPIDPAAPALDDRYRTAWAAVVPAAGGTARYSAQPHGSPLYGFDTVVRPTSDELLGPVRPAVPVPHTDPFPLVPYGLAVPREYGPVISFGEEDIAGVEQFAVASTRRARLGPPGPASPSGAALQWTTTPSGLLASVDPASGAFTSVVLGVNRATGCWLAFTDPGPVLRQALQTSDLFLVAVDPKHLGVGRPSPAGADPPPPDGTPAFYNRMSIEGWETTIDVGRDNTYGDYRNVLIVKGCRGRLVDLVAKPTAWTQAADFALRADGGDEAELPVLAQWLTDYVRAGIDRAGVWFDNFRAIATDPAWTGVLVLKASLTALPGDLAGLLAVIDREDSYAHHLGVAISPIGITGDRRLDITGSSSLFQLVDYANPALPDPEPVAPLPPAGPGPYDFRLLTLRALFENTSVRGFDGLAQLTLSEFFGDRVLSMDDPDDVYHTILLKCAYQLQGDVGAFVLDNTDDSVFTLDGDVLRRVEVTKAQMVTTDATTVRFDLWGFLDFGVLRAVGAVPGVQDVPFDLFGFGSPPDGPRPRAGLSFSGLSVVMDTSVDPPAYGFDVGALTFDPSRSTSRPGSLYQAFGLRLKDLLHGDTTDDPSAQDYLPVPTSAPLSGVAGKRWYALEFQLDLGTIGALANDVGLSAGLIAAWSPGPVRDRSSTTLVPYDAMAGLRLPGVTSKSRGLTVQSVLKLSVGDLRLTYEPAPPAESRYWVLWLNDIALKFLGLLKIPPNGAVGFACFGGPDAAGDPRGIGWYAVYNQDKPKAGIR